MPLFKILPADQSISSAEIIALDSSDIFSVVQRLECREADVLKDDVYSFSIRLSEGGMWSIFQRDDNSGQDAVPAFG